MSERGPEVRAFESAAATRPRWMRALNTLGRLAPTVARPDAAAWREAARSKAGETPPLPAAVADALEALCRSLRYEAELNLVGRISARDDTVRMIATQHRILHALDQNPAIRETQLPDPVFIIGWPRTGSTFLHTLLASDPNARSIPYWESFDPVPPDTDEDRRPAKVDRMLGQLAQIAPDYQAIHPMTADMSEECVALFMNELRTLQFDFQYRAPGYVRWLLAQDARIAYRAYREQLRLIHYHRPEGRHFILKDPTHLVHLDTIVELFPQARFIFTHRDPREAISSLCSLYAYTRAIFSDRVDPQAIGREIVEGYWLSALDRAQEIRAKLPPERCADVRYPDLTRAPVDTAERTYQALGLGFDGDVRDALEGFVTADRARPHRRHEHSLAGFGLQPEALRERFRSYCERFDL